MDTGTRETAEEILELRLQIQPDGEVILLLFPDLEL
jgi:hypothetical protein